MSIPVTLSNGQTIVIDELTGNVMSDGGPDGQGGRGAFGNQERADIAQPSLPPPPGQGGQPQFDPNVHRVTERTPLPGGTQIRYTDGVNTYTTFVPTQQSTSAGGASGGGGGGTAAASLAQRQAEFNYQQQSDAATLAEQQRQFDETMGYNKARFNTEVSGHDALGNPTENRRQFDASQDLQRGNTLLGLGSRPDTLIKYLYALHGQQTPQGFQNTAANLPGYQNLVGQQNYGQGQPAPQLGPQQAPALPANGGTRITSTLDTSVGAPRASDAVQGAQDALIAAGRKPKFYSDGVAIFKHGGPIPEHVIGIGMKTGKTYEFGEAGPEYVVPNDKMADLMGVIGKAGKENADGSKSYAGGGMIGASPTTADKAFIGGQWIWAGGPYSGQPVSATPATAGDLTPYLNDPSLADPTGRVSPAVQPNAQPNYQTGQWNPNQNLGPAGSGPTNLGGGFVPISKGIGGSGSGPVAMSGGSGGVQSPFAAGPSIFSTLGGQFPQVNHFTNNGQSLIPSAQRFNQGLPSERSFYSGFLQDEAGVPPEDVYDLASRLGPKVRNLSTPRYA